LIELAEANKPDPFPKVAQEGSGAKLRAQN